MKRILIVIFCITFAQMVKADKCVYNKTTGCGSIPPVYDHERAAQEAVANCKNNYSNAIDRCITNNGYPLEYSPICSDGIYKWGEDSYCTQQDVGCCYTH